MSTLDFSSLSPQELEKALNDPALPPPAGVTPDFAHPQNKNGEALAGLIFSLVLASTFLFIRVYVVFFKSKQSRLGDCECFLFLIPLNSRVALLILLVFFFFRSHACRICTLLGFMS